MGTRAIRNAIRAVARVTLLAGVLVSAPSLPGQTGTPPATRPPLGSRGIRVHDPATMVRCGEEYWIFSTGHGIPSFHSKDMVDWQPGPPVFDRDPSWTAAAVPQHRGIYFWAPDVIQAGGRYLLYYSVSVFGKNTSAIGLVTNPTLDPADPKFHWTDQGIVVRSVATNDFNAIDPAVFLDVDGKLWLAFGSFWSGIKLIRFDPQTGKALTSEPQAYPLAQSASIEAAYLYRHGGHYYLFVNWGRCCEGVRSTYNIRVGRSDNLIGPYLDRGGRDMLAGGGSLFLETAGAFIGPGHAGIYSEAGKDWFSCHFYDGTRSGKPTLAILPLGWDNNGWPVILKTNAMSGGLR